MTEPSPFVPPPYPYDRLNELRAVAADHAGGCVDLSIGTPTDSPPPVALEALAASEEARGYPPSIGSPRFREAASNWMRDRLNVDVGADQLGVAVGTKEFVAGLPHLLRLRRPDLDTVLYPAVAYPSYEMGAVLAGCRAVAVPVDERWQLRFDQIDEADARRALCLWVNTPGNPTGALGDLAAAAAWGRQHEVPVFSDECYVEFTWQGDARTILEHGTDGLIAVHSLSKRSNMAGLRAGFYAGDTDLVRYLREVRKHLGMMVPGPVQDAAAAALGDQDHVDRQRDRYRHRLERLCGLFSRLDVEANVPAGAFYLWIAAPDGDAWAFARRAAGQAGVLISPGEFYGAPGEGYVRVAAVRGDDELDLIEARLG
jgi:succinyldiaminopimelate transaminase